MEINAGAYHYTLHVYILSPWCVRNAAVDIRYTVFLQHSHQYRKEEAVEPKRVGSDF